MNGLLLIHQWLINKLLINKLFIFPEALPAEYVILALTALKININGCDFTWWTCVEAFLVVVFMLYDYLDGFVLIRLCVDEAS